jgi:hypothetical protein
MNQRPQAKKKTLGPYTLATQLIFQQMFFPRKLRASMSVSVGRANKLQGAQKKRKRTRAPFPRCFPQSVTPATWPKFA